MGRGLGRGSGRWAWGADIPHADIPHARGCGRVREEFKRPALKAGVAWHDIDGAREVNVIQQEVREAVDAIRLARKENSPGRVKPLWL